MRTFNVQDDRGGKTPAISRARVAVPARSLPLIDVGRPTAIGGGFNWSLQHSSLLAKMECVP
jgi:hypothetical protein